MTRSSATSSTISTHRPPTTYRTSEPARSLALARCAAVVDRRCPDWLGRAVAAGRRGSAAALMEAARLTALAASMVPRPVPGALAPPVVEPAVVPLVSAWPTWAADRCGNRDRMSAATPATMPLDVLVELIRA